jgi:hypothetical protein
MNQHPITVIGTPLAIPRPVRSTKTKWSTDRKENPMKSAVRNNRLTLALVALCALAMTVPVIAQQSTMIEDEKLEVVAVVYLDIMEIQKKYAPRIEAATSAEEAQSVQQEASAKMLEVIESHDMITVEEYQQIMKQVQEDETLRERLVAAIEREAEQRSQS